MKESGLLNGLNEEQIKAVTHTGGPLLIVAGAGTGKTTVITRRIAYLLEQNLARPEEVLALTFTEKAAGEMEARVDQLLPLGIWDLWISTFHAFCEKLLTLHGLDLGLPGDFKLLDDVGQWMLVHKNLDRFELDYYKPLGSPDKFISSLLQHFSKCKDEMVTPEEYLEYADKRKLALDNPELTQTDDDESTEAARILEIANAYHTYQKLLLENGFLDFGDLINYTHELFVKRPNILKKYRNQFKYVLVDEFQDTNFAQYQLIKLLTQSKPIGASESGNNDRNTKFDNFKLSTCNLVVVGDDDQSIYKFRGASVSNILKLKDDYKNLEELTLSKNYRSRQNILDLAYKFIQQNNPNRLESKLGINKRLISESPEKEKNGVIQVLEGKDLAEELDLVIKKIQDIKAKTKDATWNDFAILIRANTAAEEILPRLDASGITYTYLANKGLFKKKIIYQLLNYLKLLDNYHESKALFEVLTLPKFSISQEEISHITHFSQKKTLSLYETLKDLSLVSGISDDTKKKMEALIGYLGKHSEMAKEKTAVEVFVQVILDLGVAKMLEAETLENAQNREFLEQMYKKIEDFEDKQENKSLKNFLEILELEQKAGSEGDIKFDPNLGPESLKVMTIHSAKGLEFRFVFIINMVDQRFPTRSKHDTIELPTELVKDILPEGDFHLEEERRLFYVAITRAKEQIYLSWGKDYGGSRAKKPSIFLQESELIPSEKVVMSTGKVLFSKSKTADKKQVFKQIPKSFSFTDISTFENCPLEYKFQRYLRIPSKGNPHLSFGQSIHRTLERYGNEYKNALSQNQLDLFDGENAEKRGIPTLKRMEELYEQNWLDEWYNSKKEKEEYKKEGYKILATTFEDFELKRPNIKYIEHSFSLPLGEYTFVGKIDRIDQGEKGLQIVDYKTNSSPKTKVKKDVDQLLVYQWAVEHFFKEHIEALYYWHLKDNVKREVQVGTPEALEKLQAELLEKVEEIVYTITYDLFEQKHKEAGKHNCIH